MHISSSKKLKVVSKILCLLMILQFVFSSVTPSEAFANTSSKISYSVSGSSNVGDIITISLNVANVKDLYGGSLDFVYDSSLIEVQSVEKGTIFGSDSIQIPVKKFGNGQASIAVMLSGSKSGVSTDGTLVTIKAKVLKEGSLRFKTTNSNSSLSLSGNTCRVKLSNSTGSSIEYISEEQVVYLSNSSPLNNFYEESNDLIKFNGYWSTDTDSRNSGSRARFDNVKGNSVTFNFEGTGFKWYGLGNTYKGIANVYIDGVKYTVDTYSKDTVYQKLFFEKTGLAQGKHTVKIEVSGNKNPAAVNSHISIDKIEIVTGRLLDDSNVVSYEDTHNLINFNGYWSTDTDSRNSGSRARFDNVKGNSVTFNFEGTGFKWYGLGNTYKGIANVFVDGVKYTVDTYSKDTVYQKLFFEKTGLSQGKHTVKIEVSGTKNTAAVNSHISIDKIEILDGTLVDSTTVTSYEDNDNLINFNGYWSTDTDSRNSESRARFDNVKGNSVTFNFEGSGFKWYGLGNAYKGIANVYVDGVKYTVDTYSKDTVYQKLFFEKTGLAQGKHTVKIEVSGTKNTAALNSYISIDKVEIVDGTLVESTTVTSYEDTDSFIKFNGYWSTDTDSRNSESRARFDNVKGNSVTFNFEGSGFKWYGLGNAYKGIANVYVDGVKHTVDTYSKDTLYQKLFFEKTGLSQGKHTVKIEVSGTKNTAALNSYISIDKIEIVNGTLVDSTTVTSYEDADSLINFNGYWSTDTDSRNSESRARFDNVKGNSVTFNFEGTGFKWYGLGNTYKGIANVYVDGVKYTVDTYSKDTLYQKLFFEKIGLSQGKHTVKIEVSGTKNTAALNSYISIDKIEIVNGTLVSK